jgi:hypothetical protein
MNANNDMIGENIGLDWNSGCVNVSACACALFLRRRNLLLAGWRVNVIEMERKDIRIEQCWQGRREDESKKKEGRSGRLRKRWNA